MANSNSPFGLLQIGLNGSPVTNGAMEERRNGILSTNNTAFYTGDLIKAVAGGYLEQWSAGTAVSQLWGVFQGCRYASAAQQTILLNKYWPGSGNAVAGTVLAQYIPAILSPPPLFVIQTDSTGITVADIGANADVNVGTGSTTSGKSGMYLDVGTLATTATLPLRIVDLWANRAMGGFPEQAGGSSSLVPGTQAGAYNWAVVVLNVTLTTGI